MPAVLLTMLILGQPAPPPKMRPIESNTVDAVPLMEPMRLVPVDLRLDTSFSRVYELRVNSRLIGGESDLVYARKAGNLTAFFPRSTFTPSESGGDTPTVPPGTIFYIGDPPTLSDGASLGPGPGRPDLSADLSAREFPELPARSPVERSRRLAPPREAQTIWTSELTRNARISTLLDAACRAR